MINIKNDYEIEMMKKAGKIVGDTHNYLIPYIKEGITTKELDSLASEYIISRGATPSFKNYNGYPANICISINEEVVHGIPDKRKLKDGDIVSIDIGACYEGYHGDSAWSYPVGNITKKQSQLLKHTEEALFEGLKVLKEGAYVKDISEAIERHAKKHNLGIVRELVGHGIGSSIHEEPDVPNYVSKKYDSIILKAGMVIAVEPMLNAGTANVYVLDDKWTVVTADGGSSAHFEHTVLVTKEGFLILTER